MKVVVVGGGLAGLSAAYSVRSQVPDAEVVVLEASNRAGGLLRTEHVDGFVIERGAESIITSKPAALELAMELGLEPRVIRTRKENRGAYVVRSGELHRIPQGFSVVAPGAPWALARSPILSPAGKARAALDFALPRGKDAPDESLGRFVRRRFGRELLERLAQPMAAGIYGARPDRLSLAATMPRFLELERENRSVTLGLMRRADTKASAGARYGMFINFDGGSEVLIDALVERLGKRIQRNRSVTGVRRTGRGWVVETSEGGEGADAVILAVPAWRVADLIDVGDDLASELRAIEYGSAATVTFAWRESELSRPLDASGFVVPAVESRLVLAATWSSAKWPGRAPEGMALIRVFLGGNGRDEVVGFDDDELSRIARRGLRDLMRIRATPSLQRVDRYVRVMPRYEPRHLDRATRIESFLDALPGLAFAGGFLRGVGVPDTIRSGARAASKIAADLT